MLSEIGSRYYRALKLAFKKESSENIRHSIQKLVYVFQTSKIHLILTDPFQKMESKFELVKQMQLDGYLQNCMEEMIRNNRTKYIEEVINTLSNELRSDKLQLTIITSSVRFHMIDYLLES
jgi:F0F1-type ATP synthase delta subunit